jgi:hypothetical protein
MNDREWLAQKFEQKRSHLRAVAYRMLGSLGEGRRRRSGGLAAAQSIRCSSHRELGCVANHSRRTNLLRYVAFSPLATGGVARGTAAGHDPGSRGPHESRTGHTNCRLCGFSSSRGTRNPGAQERLAFVLHDMFAVPFEEIASILGCSPVAARQLANRARRRVRAAAPTPDVDLHQQRKVVDAFLREVRAGDFEGLVAVLDPNVILRSDRGAEGFRVIRRAQNVAQQAIMFSRLAHSVQPALVNGTAGIVSWLPNGAGFFCHGLPHHSGQDRGY